MFKKMMVSNLAGRLILLFASLILLIITYFLCISNRHHNNMPDQVIIFSEHTTTFAGSHDMKLLDIRSNGIADFGVKTGNGGIFFLIQTDKLAWLDKEELNIFNPLTRTVDKKWIPYTGRKIEGRNLRVSDFQIVSISPNGNKFAYLSSAGPCLYIGGLPKFGKKQFSLGSKSDLHVFDLMKNKDSLIVQNVFEFGVPQWSPDGQKILYTGPKNDNYFDQVYLNKIAVEANISWQELIQGSIFVYDLDSGTATKLCLGVYPQWSPDGKQISFLTEENNMGILNFQNMEVRKLHIKGVINPGTFKMAWSSDGGFIAYLARPENEFLRALLKVVSGSWYERPSSLRIIGTTKGAEDLYVVTKNFGDIKFAPNIYKKILKGDSND